MFTGPIPQHQPGLIAETVQHWGVDTPPRAAATVMLASDMTYGLEREEEFFQRLRNAYRAQWAGLHKRTTEMVEASVRVAPAPRAAPPEGRRAGGGLMSFFRHWRNHVLYHLGDLAGALAGVLQAQYSRNRRAVTSAGKPFRDGYRSGDPCWGRQVLSRRYARTD